MREGTFKQYFSEGEKKHMYVKFEEKGSPRERNGNFPDFKWKEDVLISFTRNQEFDPIKSSYNKSKSH